MKSKQAEVFELVYKFSKEMESLTIERGVTTQFISERLGMQRTNVSSMLNKMVQEGVIIKDNGRPVRYRAYIPDQEEKIENLSFSDLIGYDGSLREAIFQAKSAVLYPSELVFILLYAESGCGLTSFVEKIWNFAKEKRILSDDAPLITFVTAAYLQQKDIIEETLFSSTQTSKIREAEGGILFIKDADLLDVKSQERLFHYLTGSSRREIEKVEKTWIFCSVSSEQHDNTKKVFEKNFLTRINLPRLVEFSIEERSRLIEKFLQQEAQYCGHAIGLSREAYLCLMIYEPKYHIRDLQRDIHLAYASAYLRLITERLENTSLILSDFPISVRKGFDNLASKRKEIDKIMYIYNTFNFSKNMEEKSNNIEYSSDVKDIGVYHWIQEKLTTLGHAGYQKHEINSVFVYELEQQIGSFLEKFNKEENVFDIVDDNWKQDDLWAELLLKELVEHMECVFPTSATSIVGAYLREIRISEKSLPKVSQLNVLEIMKEQYLIYQVCDNFLKKWAQDTNNKIHVEEVICLALLIIRLSSQASEKTTPVIIVAMHGEKTATSLVDLINNLIDYPIISFDMSIEKTTDEAYFELKKILIKNNHKQGFLAIYDLEVLKHIFQRLERELNCTIYPLELPLPAMLIEMARVGLSGGNMEAMRNLFLDWTQNIQMKRNHNMRTPAILTVCLTGKGGAVSIKNYISRMYDVDGIEIINLAHGDSRMLVDRIQGLKKNHQILCLVGSYNPRVIGVPYISLKQLFEDEGKVLLPYLKNSNILDTELPWTSFRTVFDQLTQELKLIDMQKATILLPELIKRVLDESKHFLQGEHFLAIMIHITCYMERYLQGEATYEDLERKIDCENYPQLFLILKRELHILEETFHVLFSDLEIGNLIHIIVQLEKQ
jgi:transcriptional regulatory protein LevR/transcriptional regulator with AAA-type ATPase domain